MPIDSNILRVGGVILGSIQGITSTAEVDSTPPDPRDDQSIPLVPNKSIGESDRHQVLIALSPPSTTSYYHNNTDTMTALIACLFGDVPAGNRTIHFNKSILQVLSTRRTFEYFAQVVTIPETLHSWVQSHSQFVVHGTPLKQWLTVGKAWHLWTGISCSILRLRIIWAFIAILFFGVIELQEPIAMSWGENNTTGLVHALYESVALVWTIILTLIFILVGGLILEFFKLDHEDSNASVPYVERGIVVFKFVRRDGLYFQTKVSWLRRVHQQPWLVMRFAFSWDTHVLLFYVHSLVVIMVTCNHNTI